MSEVSNLSSDIQVPQWPCARLPVDDFHYSRDFHAYNTRNKDLLRLPLAKTTKYQSSFHYNGTMGLKRGMIYPTSLE